MKESTRIFQSLAEDQLSGIRKKRAKASKRHAKSVQKGYWFLGCWFLGCLLWGLLGYWPLGCCFLAAGFLACLPSFGSSWLLVSQLKASVLVGYHPATKIFSEFKYFFYFLVLLYNLVSFPSKKAFENFSFLQFRSNVFFFQVQSWLQLRPITSKN